MPRATNDGERFRAGFPGRWIDDRAEAILNLQETLRPVLDRLSPLVHDLWRHKQEVEGLWAASGDLAAAGASLQMPPVRLGRIALSCSHPYWTRRELIGKEAEVVLRAYADERMLALLEEAKALDSEIRALAVGVGD